MSAKNRRDQKRLRRAVKSVTVPVPASVDLVAWLQVHGHAETVGQARQIIKDGRVRSESHKLTTRFVPARLRGSLYVTEQ